jgi:hypothetical protein
MQTALAFVAKVVYSESSGYHNNDMKMTWSRKKIRDKFTGMKKLEGTPMSRQQVHMLRKKARGICLTCGKPALGVYCLKHTIKARERMRVRLKYHRRLRGAPSYVLQARERTHARPGRKPRSRARAAAA